MPLARNIAILQARGPRGELTGDTFCFADQSGDLRLQMLHLRPLIREAQNRSHFSGRTARNKQKAQQLVLRPALKTFGNIVPNRKRRPLQLIAQITERTTSAIAHQVENAMRHPIRRIPNRQILKSFIFHDNPV